MIQGERSAAMRCVRATRMQRALQICCCVVCLPFLCGCIVPYAYPRLSYTPQFTVDVPRDELHAFRVDFTNHGADLDSFLPEDGLQQLSEISLDTTAKVPGQPKLSADHGFAVIGVALNYIVHTNHTVGLRIYRPGFELVEIHSWEDGDNIVWISAPDIAAQEQVLDRMFPINRLDHNCKAKQHTRAMLFGASEYDRLAGEALDVEDQNRLRSKAVVLRERSAS